MVEVNCQNCGKSFVKSIGRYNEAVKNSWNLFCSIKCRYGFQEKGKEFPCAWCLTIVSKTPAELRKTKANVFCSKTCSAHFNNRNKKSGTRRSKLESFIEEKILAEMPYLQLLCNSKKLLGYELDFYFPQLKLAIEFNGIHHFQPIFGLQKLNRIQEIDREKIINCKKLGVELQIIDVSKDFHLSVIIKEKRWKQVREMILAAENYSIGSI